MTETDIEGVIAAQAALIAALDAGDVAAIEGTTTTLSRLLLAIRSSGAPAGVRHDRVDHALRQTDAARARVNYLADRNRQRLDRLAERRGARRPSTYNSTGRFAVFGG
jgi:hypothetical protein